MKVIVLSNSKYKENDVIYNAISEEGSLSFKAYRGQDNKSPAVWLNNPLVIADIDLSTDKRLKYPTLKEAKLISSPMTGDDSLEYLYAVNLLSEAANNMLQENERHLLFKEIEDALTSLKEKKDILMVVMIYLARIIKLSGGELEVDECVFCGKTKEIVAFSFLEGGFICRDCLQKNEVPTDLSPNQMLLIRYIFKSPNYSCVSSERYSTEDKIVILKNLKTYISDELGVNLSSIDMLLKYFN